MGADDVLRVIPNPSGGLEVRFAIGKLSQLSVAARQDLAKRMADDVHRKCGSGSDTSANPAVAEEKA